MYRGPRGPAPELAGGATLADKPARNVGSVARDSADVVWRSSWKTNRSARGRMLASPAKMDGSAHWNVGFVEERELDT